jgi:predicted metal-binding membrane protein
MLSTLEQAIRSDRLVVWLSVAVITAVAWIDLVRMSANMPSMAGALMPAMLGADTRLWGAADWLGLFLMWAVMMIGMMVPSVAPVLLHMLQIFRRRGDRLARASAAAFVGGHLLPWMLFSAAAAAAQVGLHRAALLGTDMASQSMVLSGTLLIVAGIYQFLPAKTACLEYCRPPLRFLSMKRRDGTGGAFRMGLEHGWFCVGCCSAFMALLFVFGVMNLLWAAALAVVVLIEKIAPPRAHVEYVAGVPLIVWGVTQLARG